MAFARRDYFKERFTRDELAHVLERARLTPREALATHSRAYGALGLREHVVSDAELLDLMVAEPTLLRRPLLVSERGTMLGFDAEMLHSLTAGKEDGET